MSLSNLRQAFSWWSFCRGDTEPEALIAGTARIGYAAVEMPPQALWSSILDQGLQIASIVGQSSMPNGLNRREYHDAIEAEVESKLNLAVEWGIPNVIVFSGNRRGLSDDEGAAATISGLLRLAPLAEAAGVTLVMELLNSKVDHRDYQADRTAWGAQVCAAVDSPRIKLLYDIYHMQVMEGDVIRTIRDNHDQIGHYHTAGCPGRHDLDDDQELNYPAIVRAIAATGYQGYLGHEFLPKGDSLAALAAAYRLCESNWIVRGNSA